MAFVAFEGFRLQLGAVFSVPGDPNEHAPPWAAPIVDNQGWWSAGSPAQVVVPAGVTFARFEAGFFADGVTSGDKQMSLRRNGAVLAHLRLGPPGNSRMAGTITSGPVVVAPGDVIEALVNTSAASTYQVTQATFFAGESIRLCEAAGP